METLQTREIKWTIPALKTRLDELDRQINVLRAERAGLGLKFDRMLRESAKQQPWTAPAGAQPAWYSDKFDGTGFEDSPVVKGR